ncbi:MAG: type II secretion system GspH family protein [Candidatus Omnitrophica bacterium]|nr:type II secretion system GspH family protein [Candidatus Omnitrophota bacterium]
MIKSFRKAFSLIEIAVTITVLGLVIAGIVPMVSSAFQRIHNSNRKSMAYRLAQEMIEELQATNLTDNFYANLYTNQTAGIWITTPGLVELGSATINGNATYGDLGFDPNPINTTDQYDYFRRLVQGSWDLDADLVDPVDGDPDDLPGELARVRVTVAWDFNQDGADDDSITVTTQKSVY